VAGSDDRHLRAITGGSAGEAPPPQGDVELVTRARMGERGAMAEIYRLHRRGIGRSLLLLTHDAAAVDDLVQDTFLTAFDRLHRFSGDCKLSTWLHGIALNVARNHRARRRRRQGLLRRWFGGRSEASSRTPERDLGERESLHRLWAVLDELPVAQREAFIVRIIDEVPLAEASRILGASVATISYRARKAEALVRQKMEGSS
jgi:RNA polymerase sigma-70 factor (ECF subfamily)